jgi:integrase
VRKLASGRYQARYLDPDVRHIVPAPGTFASKTAADRWLARKRADLDAGTAVDDRAGSEPLAQWWPGYQRSIQARKGSTQISYSTAWRLRIEPRFGSTPVRRIKPSDVDEWIAEMSDAGVSPTKVIEAVGVFRRLLDRAVRDRAIPVNPCSLRRAHLPRRPQVERPVLSPVEVERLANAVTHEADQLLVRLLAYEGVRISEAFGLQWADVDFQRRTLTVRRSVSDVNGRLIVGPTKTYETRTITLLDVLAEQLITLQNERDAPAALVFPSRNGSHRRYGNWRRDVWDKACRSSGLEVKPHDLRATAASLLIDAGASVKDVQHHLGHATVETTLALYARVRPERSEDLASRLDRLIVEGTANHAD